MGSAESSSPQNVLDLNPAMIMLGIDKGCVIRCVYRLFDYNDVTFTLIYV